MSDNYLYDLFINEVKCATNRGIENVVGVNTTKVYNAKYYGATGDGLTDDATALNQLIQTLYANGGGTIYLPAGTYMLDAQLTWKSNVSLIGDGVGVTIIKPRKVDAEAENFPAIGYLESDGYTKANPMVNCRFCDFTIDGEEVVVGTYNTKPKGIFILHMKDCSFERLAILNTGATGLGIDFLQNVTISKIYCYNCGRAYVVTDEETVAGGAGIGIATMGGPVESCVISDCITEGCGNYGIFVEGTNQWYLYTDENGDMATESHYTIANCHCINGRNYGIVVKGTHNVVVANNICTNNARDGFAILGREYTYSKNITFTNNQSVNNGAHGFRIHDYFNNSKNITINGNFVDGNAGDGFNLYANTTVSNLTISDNTFSNNGTSGIYLGEMTGNSHDITISGNHVYNNTSDGILISYPISDSSIVNNVIRNNVNRGIAFADKVYTNIDMYGNVIRGNAIRDWHINGTFTGLKPGNQAVRVLYSPELKWQPGLLDNTGVLVESDISFVTEDYFYCGGAQWVCFDRGELVAGTGNRIVGASFYTATKEHVSREYAANTSTSLAKFNVPTNAAYVRFRIGYTESITDKDAVLAEVNILMSATDRT